MGDLAGLDPLVFRIMGPLEVVDADGAVAIGGAKRRGLLAYLLVHRGSVVSVDRIVDELWDGRPSDGAPGTVRTYVSQLRRLLPEGCAIETQRGGYRLVVPQEALDAARFERAVNSAGETTDPRTRLVLLDEALALWRADPLEEFCDAQWAEREATRLRGVRLRALSARFDTQLELGRHNQVLAELEPVALAHPLDEHLWAQLMVAYYRVGRQADALRAYQKVRAALIDELGIEPGPELRDLERRILDQDDGLAGPTEVATLDPSPRPPPSIAASAPFPVPSPHLPRRVAGRGRRRRFAVVVGIALLVATGTSFAIAGPGGGGNGEPEARDSGGHTAPAGAEKTAATHKHPSQATVPPRSDAVAFKVVDQTGKAFPPGSSGIQACRSEGFSVPCLDLKSEVADADGIVELSDLDPNVEYHFGGWVTDYGTPRKGWDCGYWEDEGGHRWWFSPEVIATPTRAQGTYTINFPGSCYDFAVVVHYLDGTQGPLPKGSGGVQALGPGDLYELGQIDGSGHASLVLEPTVTYKFMGIATISGWDCPSWKTDAYKIWFSSEDLTGTPATAQNTTFHIYQPDPTSCTE